MNAVFEKYLQGIGKRYAQCGPFQEYEAVFSHNSLHQKYTVYSFHYDGNLLRFFSCGEVGFIARSNKNYDANLLPLHAQIVQEIGVISDVVGTTNEYLQNISELFSCTHFQQDNDDIIEDYERKALELLQQEGKVCIPAAIILKDLHTFAYESNGNRFMYNKRGELCIYAMDHAYKNLQQYADCPEYTLYRIPELPIFEDFVMLFLTSCNGTTL